MSSVVPKDVEANQNKSRFRRAIPIGEGYWYELFHEYDTKDEGRIPLGRFRKLVHEGAERLDLSTKEVAALLSEADANKDDFIDFAEFTDMMMRLKHMYAKRISLYTTRAMLPRRQQTEPARELMNRSCCPPPLFLVCSCVLEIFIFAYQRKLCGWTACVFDNAFILKFDYPLQFWRFITYIFVHLNTQHLVGNIVGQILFGATLECAHRWRIGFIFMLGALSSGLFACAVRPMSLHMLGGSSGGVYALIAAHISNVALNWDEMKHPYVNTIVVTAYIGWDIFTALALVSANIATNTSYAGHIGGFVAGILLGMIFLRNVVKEEWESRLRKAAIVVYTLFTLSCIFAIAVRTLLNHDHMVDEMQRLAIMNTTRVPTL